MLEAWKEKEYRISTSFSPGIISLRRCEQQILENDKLVSSLANSGLLCEKLKTIVKGTDKMLRSRVFVHHYEKYFGSGVEEELEEMLMVLEAQISSYKMW